MADFNIDVVFNGSYQFEKLQSDWEQTDSLERDFIKNKPDLTDIVADSITVDELTMGGETTTWDEPEGTLSTTLPDGGLLQHGKEIFDYYTNVDTVTLVEGDVVCIKQIPGNRKAIKRLDPAQRNDVFSVVGVVTVPTIAVNAVGRVTKIGHVSPFNTAGWSDNDSLWVSAANIGKLTNVQPDAGFYSVKVGHVVVSANNGTIDVRIQVIPKIRDLSDMGGVPLNTEGQFYVLQADGTFSANKNINDYYTKTESDILIGAKQNAALSNDIQGDATSTTKYPSVKSIKDYADGLVVGLLDYRGGFDASVNQYPTAGGSGAGGEILKGDMWVVSVTGVIDGKTIHAGDSLIANIDNPAQDSSKWNTVNSNLSYIPEDVANKSESIVSDTGSDTKYPTVKAVETYSEKISNKSTNVTADADSDEKYPSVKAIKTYADGKVSKTGSETIYDTKTFDVSPNVPSIPASDTSAVNKEFVVGTATSAITKAQQWAENPEDTEVETGKYSALHWAAKAAESAEEVAIVAPVLDQRIDTLENVINSMNPNQEARTTASGVDTISLPKTAANGGMNVQIFGDSDATKNVFGTGRVRSVGNNLIKPTYIQGFQVSTTDGTFVAGATFSRSDYFRVAASTAYILSSNTNTGTDHRISFYDSAKVFISGATQTSGQPISVTSPANAYYAIVSSLTTKVDTFRLTRGTASFEPYRESILQLTTPELRSNGLIKDEIRKGTNGYELVKRVGVGTLGANGMPGGNFEGGMIGAKVDSDGSVSTWSLNTSNPISGTQDGRLIVTTDPSSLARPTIQFGTGRSTGQYRRLSFDYKTNSGSPALGLINTGGSTPAINKILSGSGKFELYYTCDGTQALIFYFAKSGLYDLQLDNIKDELINTPDGAATGDTATVLGSNIHYTLATPTIAPISHAGILNSNSNGTVYFEPIIADAGVYSSNLAVQLTDYPISSFESIRKYTNGTYTELNTATAVIASGGLSFTHPDLVSGDLVLFTYYYNRESIGRNMTLTHYDNRYVVADTANSKVYRWAITSTNGVASITLTEV